ncbi:hypothetical protein D3C83_05290 [compost metagenome]
MLFLAARIGKPEINEFHFVVLDQFHYFGDRHFFLLISVNEPYNGVLWSARNVPTRGNRNALCHNGICRRIKICRTNVVREGILAHYRSAV